MRLTITRWLAGATIAAAVVVTAAVLVTERANARAQYFFDDPFVSPKVTARARAVGPLRQRELRRLLDLRMVQAWEHSAASGDRGVVYDRALPDSMRDRFATLLAPALATLDSLKGRERAAFFIHYDAFSRDPRVSHLLRGNILGVAVLQLAYILPERTHDGRCVVVLIVSPSTRPPERLPDATGLCRPFARFGAPGRAMSTALGALDWGAPRAFSTMQGTGWPHDARLNARDALAPVGLACLTNESACEALWRARERFAWSDDDSPESRGVVRRYAPGLREGDVESRALLDFLERMEGDVGASRFDALWRGDGEPREAFAKVAGVTRPAWTQRWLRSMFALPTDAPRPSGPALAWAFFALLGVSLLAVCARPPRAS